MVKSIFKPVFFTVCTTLVAANEKPWKSPWNIQGAFDWQLQGEFTNVAKKLGFSFTGLLIFKITHNFIKSFFLRVFDIQQSKGGGMLRF